jgi:diguanylate cyclase (GGDEF)-like protein
MTKHRILLIQSTETQGDGTKGKLEDGGHSVIWAGSGLSALSLARTRKIDLILLDMALPDIEGLDLCHRFREQRDTRFIPIILITERDYTPVRAADKLHGPDDYLARPYTQAELDKKIEMVMAAVGPKQMSGARPAAPQNEQAATGEPRPASEPAQIPARSPQKTKDAPIRHLRLVEKADAPPAAGLSSSPILPFPGTGDQVIDPATGLFSRPQFEAMFSKEFKRAVRFKQQMSCMLIDLEGQAGERTADETMIKAIIKLVLETIREVDTAAWWSGESIIILLPNTIRNDAVQAAARILENVANHPITWPDSGTVTMSIGVAGLPNKNIDTERKLIEAADTACKRAREMMVPPSELAQFLKHQESSSPAPPSPASKKSVLKS